MTQREPHTHSPYGQLVGTRVVHADRERGTIEIEYETKPEFTNRIGTVAGGMIAGLLDSVTGLVANGGLPRGEFAVHTSLSVRYHSPASPGRVSGRGEVVSVSGRDIESRGELFDEQGTRLASAEATLRVIRNPKKDG